MRALLIVAAVLVCVVWLTGCATSAQGKSMDQVNTWDMGSTVVGLSMGFSEANPYAAITLPLKVMSGRMVDGKPCHVRQAASKGWGFTWVAVGNNIALIAGLNPLGGAIAGLAYAIGKKPAECDTKTMRYVDEWQDYPPTRTSLHHGLNYTFEVPL